MNTATKDNMSEVDEEHYPDKEQVAFVQDPSILKKYFRSRPEELDEAIQHIDHVLSTTKQSDEFIVVELHLEERTKSSDPVKFRCSPKWTVLSTKFKLCEIFPNYTPQDLYVLFRRRIAKNWMYLKQCGIERNGDALYVYIYSPQPRPPLNIQPRHLTSNNDHNMLEIPSATAGMIDSGFLNVMPDLPPGDFNPGNFEFPTGKDFPMAPPPDGSIGKLWVCKTCTFLNEDWRTDCCMCNSNRTNDNNTKPLRGALEMAEPFPSFGQAGIPVEKMRPIPVVKMRQIGWVCPGCTFVNEPTRPGCEICSVPRPEDYKIPEDHIPSEKEQQRLRTEEQVEHEAAEQHSYERRENYTKLLSVADQTIIHSEEPVECMICFTEADPGESIVLRECLHKFCKDCICEHVKKSGDAVVRCPYMDDQYKCENAITHQEIKALLPEHDFKKFLDRGLVQAEKESPNSFHCKTPDCNGWCVYEDQVNNFLCPVCRQTNCLICKAIHEGKDCKEYQDELMKKAATDEEAKKTKLLLDRMLKDGEAIHCPQCNIIMQKKVGCDWIRCPMCKLEICWVTKGPRWGPAGHGDTSGGCRCRVNGKRCHKDCNNCH